MVENNPHSRDYVKKKNDLLLELPEFVTDYINSRSNDISQNTACAYVEDIYYFLSWCILNLPLFDGKKTTDITFSDIDLITVNDADNFLSKYGDNRSRRTVARKKASLLSFFNNLYAKGYIKANPFTATGKVKIKENQLIFLTVAEQDALLNVIKNGVGLSKKQEEFHKRNALRDYAIVNLILDTGLRVSEAQGIRIRDIDFKENNVFVTRKEGKKEYIYFSDMAKESLKDYIDSKPDYAKKSKDSYLFTNYKGEPICVKTIENMVKKYANIAIPQKYGKITPHKLRSSFAMAFYKNTNNDILLLKKRLSHADISTTQIYARATDEQIIENRNWRK